VQTKQTTTASRRCLKQPTKKDKQRLFRQRSRTWTPPSVTG